MIIYHLDSNIVIIMVKGEWMHSQNAYRPLIMIEFRTSLEHTKYQYTKITIIIILETFTSSNWIPTNLLYWKNLSSHQNIGNETYPSFMRSTPFRPELLTNFQIFFQKNPSSVNVASSVFLNNWATMNGMLTKPSAVEFTN